MVQARWRLDRIARMEAEAFEQLLNVPMADGKTDEGALVALYPIRGALLDKLHRYARDNERAYYRAGRELNQYRKAQPEEKKQEPVQKSAARNEPNRRQIAPLETEFAIPQLPPLRLHAAETPAFVTSSDF
jgi:hypothetical protein